MTKVVWSAGHGLDTPGKRSPNDEREWSFNNKVVTAGMAYLAKYEDVQQLRVDDLSGRIDVPLLSRTNKANAWGGDIYISCHHNALGGSWGNHSGVETFTFKDLQENSKSVTIAKLIHPKVVKAMGLTNRGLKTENFHELRETNMPAVLVEGGFMDSRIDIIKMRDDKILKAQGEAVASGIVEYFELKLKKVNDVESPIKEKNKLFNTGSLTLNNEFKNMLVKAREQGWITSTEWETKAIIGTLTESEAIALTAIVLKRAYLDIN
ncbi:MAG TPA: N-acetylmuramoyl-L-alanine amidase [Paenisporosarcina sp.]|nr:N-acetylmuramoyl-L-alanine amidase [Paenisporosarcina sp.]